MTTTRRRVMICLEFVAPPLGNTQQRRTNSGSERAAESRISLVTNSIISQPLLFHWRERRVAASLAGPTWEPDQGQEIGDLLEQQLGPPLPLGLCRAQTRPNHPPQPCIPEIIDNRSRAGEKKGYCPHEQYQCGDGVDNLAIYSVCPPPTKQAGPRYSLKWQHVCCVLASRWPRIGLSQVGFTHGGSSLSPFVIAIADRAAPFPVKLSRVDVHCKVVDVPCRVAAGRRRVIRSGSGTSSGPRVAGGRKRPAPAGGDPRHRRGVLRRGGRGFLVDGEDALPHKLALERSRRRP
eukprot:scaffold12350_cov192-Isochrysis_galbana.AAC.1